MSANVQSMMFTGDTPWHGLGKKLDHPATAAEAIQAAGLDWEVKKVPVSYMDLHSHHKAIPNTFAVRRQDNGQALGVVGRYYNPLQNKEAFSFFDAIVGAKEAIYHTAGALGDGQRVWLLAKLPQDIIVKGHDKVEKFLMLSNAHDGTSTVTVKMTPIRVVCQNTLNLALKDGEAAHKLRHTRWLGTRVEQVRQTLGLVVKQFDQFGEAANHLASKPCTDEQFVSYIEKIGLVEPKEKMGLKTTAMVEDVLARFAHGLGNDERTIKQTWWAAYNAVTEFTDHSPLFGKAKTQSDRARSLLYGAGSFVKQRAWDQALVLAGK